MTCKVEQLARPARFQKTLWVYKLKTEQNDCSRLRKKTYKVGKTLQVRQPIERKTGPARFQKPCRSKDKTENKKNER
ncbi:hypothetical protein SAMN03080594_101347 [Arenibacter palladensis]|uniref:Uncharacterized protein n=1 Tax=Arenibacter palladensis TaxID=237373 RepID=A0A1M4TRG2_9FLAO|nr:hypothetical protein SAMN03080594_101347 [Arenibacter palladensis]